jgi:glutamate--cysteine ligase
MAQVAELLDIQETGSPHGEALAALAPLLDDPELTPSGEYLKRLRDSGKEYSELTFEEARRQAEALAAEPGDTVYQAQLEELVERTIQQQKDIEAADTQSFDDFLEDYFTRANESCTAVIMAAGEKQ